ncbi:hypothetical protein F3Y22_tig00110482pilonHSYRG00561 [Hibiscus syriacus]|uniref:Uncharacterized protein n=1 Tax=Hibiscus syriacus TaxID=106335 RepID=A0A6A3AIB6_HIBSY|nr:hypothetical protein F3Y22_tig00110482pilonHSYRG00561 [Hibiscus syriacus]
MSADRVGLSTMKQWVIRRIQSHQGLSLSSYRMIGDARLAALLRVSLRIKAWRLQVLHRINNMG